MFCYCELIKPSTFQETCGRKGSVNCKLIKTLEEHLKEEVPLTIESPFPEIDVQIQEILLTVIHVG